MGIVHVQSYIYAKSTLSLQMPTYLTGGAIKPKDGVTHFVMSYYFGGLWSMAITISRGAACSFQMRQLFS